MYLVGLDVGTTGAKAMVLDFNGKIISSGYREYPCSYPNKGWVEQEGSTLMAQSFEACKEAVEKSGIDSKDIVGVGFSVQRATFGFINEQGRLIDDKFYVWQDNRAAEVIDDIKKTMNENELYEIQGQPITPTFAFEKLIWMKKHQPNLLNEAHKIVFVSDFIMQAFGVEGFFTEVTNAGCSALLDIKKMEWSETILDRFEIDKELLCPLVKPGKILGHVNKEVAKKSGLAEGTPLCTGSGDNQCGALGAGVVNPGDASMSLGTSGVLVAANSHPVFIESMGLMVNPSAAEGVFQMEGIQLGAASSYKWAKDNLAVFEKIVGEEIQVDPFVLMEKHINSSVPGSNGVIFMPFLIGSGYPYWDTEASGLFAGISFSNTKSDMIRAVMEGITLESKDMLENMKNSGIDIQQVTIIGGATKSKAWRQIIADMFGMKVRCLEVSDATIVGAAILAGVGTGVFKNAQEGVERMVRFTDEVAPIEENLHKYNNVYESYKGVYRAFRDCGVYSSLSRL